MSPKVLLTGGKGKTALRIASLLHTANIPFLLTSRSGEFPAPYEGVRFDWLDESTFNAPFDGTGVDTVYLVPPPAMEIFDPMKKFIDLAVSKGVNRLVLLSSTIVEPGGPATSGALHKYILTLGIDYCVLRPTWFMENISEERHPATIREENIIYSATGSGQIPWISTDDIAAVAIRALSDKKSHNTDHILLGPELLSYDQIAQQLSTALRRKITHVSLSQEEFEKHLSLRMPENFAKMVAIVDIHVLNGKEAKLNGVVENIIGRPPKDFKAFIDENNLKSVWTI